jgi:hypothetical protein
VRGRVEVCFGMGGMWESEMQMGDLDVVWEW